MFTATTCVCVTGLVTVTTATHWSLIGKLVILLLIQIGGIGLIALASVIFISLNKKISLKNRRMIQESYNLEQMSGLVTVVRKWFSVCLQQKESEPSAMHSALYQSLDW